MALTIQHNMGAINARNKMNTNVSGLGKASEKLSSGYQINRSADNASGLAVSEKVRSQIRGLSQATNNANDGISLIQTAEGGLQETHAILQRMRELSVQASNGTYTDTDRDAIQLEIDALKSEVSRISESTEFNTMKLLDGSLNISVNSAVLNNEYGALYGSINYDLAIGGGKITVTSSIAGMYLEFTTDASGEGGENAIWCYDVQRTDGELTQHIKINLAEGQTYTDAEIQKLIDNATVPKSFEAPTGKITFSSEYGFIHADEAETYGFVTGYEKQEIGVSTKSLATQSTVRYEIWSKTGSQNFSVVWDLEDACSDVPNPGYNPNYPYNQSNENITTVSQYKSALTTLVNNSDTSGADALKAAASGLYVKLTNGSYDLLSNYLTANSVSSSVSSASKFYTRSDAGVDTGGNPIYTYTQVDDDTIANPCYNSNYPYNESNPTDHVTDTTQTPISVDADGTIHLNHNCKYSEQVILDALTAAGQLDNTNATHDGGYADEDQLLDSPDIASTFFASGYIKPTASSLTVSYSEKYEQDIREYYQYYTFDLTANQYGSYSEYLADEEKYRQPDCIEDFNRQALSGVEINVSGSATEDIQCSVSGDKLTVTLKEGYTSSSPSEIRSAIQSYLNSNGYNYTVSSNTYYTGYSTADKLNDQLGKFIALGGTSASGTLIQEGGRYVKRVGTVAGERQVIAGDVSSLVGSGSSGAIDSSDYIAFTANTYGKNTDYDSLVGTIAISTDADEGEEYVEVNGEGASIHLSTGVRYSESDIEALLSKAGLDYTVSLTDKYDPDGDKDGYVFFNRSGSAVANQINAGQGVGLEDISTVTEGITLQIGANGTEDQQVTMKVEDAGAEALGIADIDVSTVDSANKAINIVDDAIRQISMQRAGLGALQNRLEYTVSNLTTSGENLTAADSQIRDTDMANEMINYTKYNILQQASQAMLAQANQQPQAILQLLG